MRYSSSALVLATFTLGHALAGPVNHAHNHMDLHKKHEILDVKAEEHNEKRGWEGINFATVKITYSKGQTWGDATSAPAAVAPTTTAVPIIAAVATTAAKVETTSSAAVASSSKVAASSGIDSTTPTVASQILSDAAKTLLTSVGAQVGTNDESNNGAIWIGSDGFGTMEHVNDSGDDIIVVCWGAVGSWVNAVKPYITHSLPSGSSFTASFASGTSGACSAIYPDSSCRNGQIANTWAEFTYGDITVFDVSREVAMSGHSLSLVGDQCTSDMSTCAFKCGSGEENCTFGYVLENCAPGSQTGAEYGKDNGADSGGCRAGSSKAVKATWT